MDKENEGFDIMSFLFNNKSFIEGLIENLKKELAFKLILKGCVGF